MTCVEVRSLLTDYVTGKLDADHKAQVDMHTSQCPDCQRNLCVARLIEGGVAADDESAPIIRIAYNIIQQAIDESAEEIRIEPEANGIRVVYRTGSALRDAMPLPKYVQPPLFSRFKTMADMDTAETRAQQEGVIHIRYNERDIDVRISCSPAEHGEQIVMSLPAA